MYKPLHQNIIFSCPQYGIMQKKLCPYCTNDLKEMSLKTNTQDKFMNCFLLLPSMHSFTLSVIIMN